VCRLTSSLAASGVSGMTRTTRTAHPHVHVTYHSSPRPHSIVVLWSSVTGVETLRAVLQAGAGDAPFGHHDCLRGASQPRRSAPDRRFAGVLRSLAERRSGTSATTSNRRRHPATVTQDLGLGVHDLPDINSP